MLIHDIESLAEAYNQVTPAEPVEEGILDRLKARVAQGAAAVTNVKNLAKAGGQIAAGKLAQAAGAGEVGGQVVQQGQDAAQQALAQSNAAKKESIKNSIVQNIQKVVGDGYSDLVKLGVLSQEQAAAQIKAIGTGFQNYIGKL